VRLRQLVLVTKEIDRLTKQICDLFELNLTFKDPELINFGLQNRMIPVGDNFIEIVSPVRDNTAAGRFLAKRDGEGGYMVIVDVPDLNIEKQRVVDANIEIVWHENRNADGINGQSLHLHPKQVGGAILSIDAMSPKSAWLWAGTDWQKDINRSVVIDLIGVVLSSKNPNHLCSKWERALGIKRSVSSDMSIKLEKSKIQFVEDDNLDIERVSAFILSTNKSKEIREKAKTMGVLSKNNIELGGINFLLSDIK
jgi:hypothetical protein